MTNYLFLILDRYESSQSKSHPIKSNLKDPKLVFRNCLIDIVAKGAEDAEEITDEIMDEVCQKGNFVTYDGEEQSFLLIKLEN
jgi:hypothetical protein